MLDRSLDERVETLNLCNLIPTRLLDPFLEVLVVGAFTPDQKALNFCLILEYAQLRVFSVLRVLQVSLTLGFGIRFNPPREKNARGGTCRVIQSEELKRQSLAAFNPEF